MIVMMITLMRLKTIFALYDDDNDHSRMIMVMMGMTMAMLQGIEMVHQELSRVAWL